MLVIRLVLVVLLAVLLGKLLRKIKLPSILGWLIAGMIFGPHAVGLMSDTLLNQQWYKILMHVLECGMGIMIGTELVWSTLKKSGKSIIITTLTQSLGTFFLVSFVFSILFSIVGVPIYLAFILGAIALATAPAPALSIINEFHTSGPVTRTLLPMAALDDVVAIIVFFSTITIVTGNASGKNMNPLIIVATILLPAIIGVIVGIPTAWILKKTSKKINTIFVLIVMIVLTSGIGMFCNYYLMEAPTLNFMLMGMSFSAVFSNMISKERLEKVVKDFRPILGISIIMVILNLGAPLDFRLILGAGGYTAVYIIVRACGKYAGARFGATITKSPDTVKKYLGLTLLPHSGVSLVFTGIAVSSLSSFAPDSVEILQGTIVAAAVINEIIAVIVAKKGFEWAGEIPKK